MCKKLNCWEYMNCGMEPGGLFAKNYGPCPIPQMMRHDGVNGGRGAGRVCWEVMPGKSGDNSISCRNRRSNCNDCKFYLRVHSEEEEMINSTILEKA